MSKTKPRTPSSTKSKLGQFYTTNYEYILQSFTVPDGLPVIEPFAGNGDLLRFVKSPQTDIECYDIDPKKEHIIRRDTLLNPPSYSGKFVLTNPPYLAKNKSDDKEIYNKYGCDDLYKCFIKTLILDVCEGGIIIVPLNFISSIRDADVKLRKAFVGKYHIIHINIFEEQVFGDTAYTVCSILFRKIAPITSATSTSPTTICDIYPSGRRLDVAFAEHNNYSIGGEIYYLPINTEYKIERATKNTANKDNITNILVKCIDDNANSTIRLEMVNAQHRYIDNTPNLTERSYATLVIEPSVDDAQQRDLVIRFNAFLGKQRNTYHSLFLTNYRESNTIARKRISFGLVFQICGYLLRVPE